MTEKSGYGVVYRRFEADQRGIEDALSMVRSYFEQKEIAGRESTDVLLAAEEAITDLVLHSKCGSDLSVTFRFFLGTITVEFSAPGEEYDFGGSLIPDISDIWAMPESDAQEAFNQIILRNYQKLLKYKHRRGCNTIRLTVARQYRTIYLTIGALLAAVFIGAFLSVFGQADQISALDTLLLSPVTTMYLNALKMVAAPVVFFSIAGCLSRSSDPRGVGRIGGKVLCLYMLTTIIAVAVGIGIFLILRPGDPSALSGLTEDVSALTAKTFDISIKDVIVGIVPSDFITPFADSNMMQLIFMAILSGIAVGQIGGYSRRLQEMFEALEELFLKIAAVIIRVAPVAVFCFILSLILKIGAPVLLSVLGMFVTFLCGLACMIVIYGIILAFSGLNPLHFLQKYAPTMLQVFSIASSNASITVNIDACDKKLGISPRIYSLSIPLGATINMDGMCIILAVQALTVARIYGVDVSGGMLLGLAVSIIVMSIGAPGVPGSGIIIMSMLLTQIGVPAEGAALAMGIAPLGGMFICMCNCLGDVVITTVVAKTEKMINMEVYQKKSR